MIQSAKRGARELAQLFQWRCTGMIDSYSKSGQKTVELPEIDHFLAKVASQGVHCAYEPQF